MNAENAKTAIEAKIKVAYPNSRFAFQCDSEDDGIVYVRIFGVPDNQVAEHKSLVWDIIDSIGEVDEICFIPSIISMSNTLAHHREFLPVANDFDQAVSDHVFKRIFEWDDSAFSPLVCESEIPHPAWSCNTAIDILEISKEMHNEHSFNLAA